MPGFPRDIMQECANKCYRAPMPPSPGRAARPVSLTCWLKSGEAVCRRGSYSARGILGRVGELNRARRDVCGDPSRASLPILVLFKFKFKFEFRRVDLRASEGEVDSLLVS